jgi:hypothetical protein
LTKDWRFHIRIQEKIMKANKLPAKLNIFEASMAYKDKIDIGE